MNYITIDKTSTIPIYKQLQTSIQSAILGGKLKPLDLLPKEEEVCLLCNITRQVVRKAYTELIDEGWVARKKGGSPYVYRKLHFNIPLKSLPLIDEHPNLPYKLERRILVVERMKQTDSSDAHLFDEMYRTSIVYMHGNIPLYRQEIFLDANLSINLQLHHFYTTDFIRFIEQDNQIEIDRISNYAFQGELSKINAELLLLPIGSPVMNVESHVFDIQNRRIAVIESVYPGDYFHFTHEESYGN